MHFYKTPFFHYALFKKAEPNSPLVILLDGFVHNGADQCMYSKFTKEYGVIACFYVDDILIFGTNMKGACEIKKYLSSMFEMKDLNKVDIILGIKIK